MGSRSLTPYTCRLCLFLLLITASAAVSATEIPEVNALTRFSSGKVNLTGKWGLIPDQWPSLEDIKNRKDLDILTIYAPSYLSEVPATAEQNGKGFNTFLLNIYNLDQIFDHPAIEIAQLNEAWQAWWIDESGAIEFLGESGKIARTPEQQINQIHPYLLEFPPGSSGGTLVIYQSAFHMNHTGINSEMVIAEKAATLRGILTDIAARFLFFGVGFFVVLQNLAFYFQRRKDSILLLLATFAAVTVARSAIATGYVDYFVNRDNFSFISLRLEYILIVLPGVIAVHLLHTVFPIKKARLLLYTCYGVLAATAIVTVWLPVSTMTRYLPLYQLVIVGLAAICVCLITNGTIKRNPNAKSFLITFSPIFLALVNDIIVTQTPNYSFFCTDYAIFIFLFLQTQLQASRFVSALDTAEHLTDNLQDEVRAKTEELSFRNRLLVEKTEHLEEQHNHIKLMSETDHLTGLFNRQTLEAHAQLQIQLARTYDQPLSLVMMDLDNFKQINDQYGHTVGDECLIFAGSYLRGFNLRKRDLIARYGGEELVILLHDTDLDSAADIVENLCEGLSKVPVVGDHPNIYLTASFGIAELHSSSATALNELINCADVALYRAKQNGKNRVERHRPSTAALKL